MVCLCRQAQKVEVHEGAISDSLDSSRALFGSVDCTKIEEQLFEALEYGPGML